ncbi:hypothetical protein D7V94_10490 [Parablautia intestinalis]|uniref:Rpn family recombination-promoting nuclease/putative transposase n=1 Tax=Parablautia intestinalis TaxID=2320100 RepID=A0A3A9AIA3_9FIRM|nr:hypothetical protein [Parablautia intestinalis]RKI91320.1 hypothetical protein D7V94_10490 [Parablautia intestinalis]
MGYTKKTLQELDLIDNFLSNAIASNQELSGPFYRLLLSVLLEKELKEVRVLAQQIIPAATPELRGIRMDVEVTEYDEGTVTNLYDIEPHLKDGLHLPRHNRYYQAKIDGRYIKRGMKDFSKIPNLYVITITNYDLFGKDYMMYTVHNKCEEIPDMEYDDGLKFLYFYTKGKKGGSQAIKNMLTYIQNSESKNAVDEATKKIDFYVSRVKNLPEVEAGYMTLGDWIDSIKEDMAEEIREEVKEEVREEVKEEVRQEVKEEVRQEVKKEVREEITESLTKEVTDEVTEKVTSEVKEQNIKIMIGVFQEYHDTKENAAAKLRCKFPEYAQQAEELIEKYWEEG